MATLDDTTKQHHLLPFAIDLEGPIDAAQFLSVIPSTTPQINVGTWVDACARRSTVIMGRLLEGIEVTPPDNCQGHVWTLESTNTDTQSETNSDYDDDYEEHIDDEDSNGASGMNNTGKVWSRSTTTVDSFILWKKDVAPSPMDPRLNAIESWMNIADMIHKPIPINQ
ncbi:hypothetical protein BCR42DRAFT_450376 [Absidia repens]|uniref:Uncharacterized protein n=1 Tax=Absidia repens TaxID=90262 RepID=A0A1X2IJS8_9FUNG|nr:hypothetical protein BCR42DRAFT_450376 [Absidia repens]